MTAPAHFGLFKGNEEKPLNLVAESDVYVSDFREGQNQFVKEGHPLFNTVIVDIESE